MNTLYPMLDEATRLQIHACLEARMPHLHEQLLKLLGLAPDAIQRLRAECARQAGTSPGFRAMHTTRVRALELDAAAADVFPLLCPVRENDWIDGWSEACTLLHSHSGVAEEGCVFTTLFPAEGRAVWICSDHDASGRRIEYIKHVEGMTIAKWQMQVQSL